MKAIVDARAGQLRPMGRALGRCGISAPYAIWLVNYALRRNSLGCAGP
jgi:hypothetical protein